MMEPRSEENRFTRASQILIALILIVAPFPFGSVEDFWIFALEIGISLLLVLWVASQLTSGEVSLVRTRLTWPVIALTAYLFLTLVPIGPRILGFLSSDTAFFYRKAAEMARDLGVRTSERFPITLAAFDSQGEFLQYLCYVLFFFLALNLLRYHKVYLVLYRAIIATGAAVAAVGLAQNTWSNGKIYWLYESGSGSPFGPFVNHNHFAGYIELGLGLGLGMLLAEIWQFKEKTGFRGVVGYFAWILHKDGSGAWIIFVACFLMLVSLVASLSRGGVLSFGAASILFGLRALSFGNSEDAETPQTRRSRNLRIIAGSGLAAILLIVAVLASTPHARSRWTNVYDSSLRFRFDIWNDSLQSLSDFALTGTGLGSFRTVFPHYISAPFSSEVTHAENEYLQWTFETGFLGLILLAVTGLALAHQVVFRLSSRRDFKARCLGFGAIFSLISIGFHNIGDFNMHVPSNALTTVAAIVLCLIAINFHKGKHGNRFLLESLRIPVRSIGGMAILLSTLILAGFIVQKSWVRYESLKSEQRWIRDNPYLPRTVPDQKLLEPLAQAVRRAPDNDHAYFLQASVYESAASVKGFMQLFKKGEMLTQAEEALGRAIQLRPASARYWATLGRIEMARERYDLAEKAFQHAVQLARSNALIHRDYAIALLVAGKPQAAAAQFTIARNYTASLPLTEMLEALASRTNDTRIWQSVVRYQPEDLKIFATFLRNRGLTSMADQFRMEAEQLEKNRTSP